ncbi:hypothetical protein M885DRAFT_573188, partial [Pelagophyceae sp. CCMP2097]
AAAAGCGGKAPFHLAAPERTARERESARQIAKASLSLGRAAASQVWRDIATTNIQDKICRSRTHELIKGWSADEEVCSPYTEGQVIKVSIQANLVYLMVRTIGERHYMVREGDLDTVECAAEALRGSPYHNDFEASTVLTWYRDYRANDGFFTPDARGSYERCTLASWVVENEDVLIEFKAWIKAGLSGLNVAKAMAYLATEVVPKISPEDKAKYKISEEMPSRAAVYGLMTHKSVGCLFRTHTKCFYVDAHEREDVRVDRAQYCTLFFEFERRMYKWIQLTAADAATLRGKYPDMSPGYKHEADGAPMVEFHVDDFKDFSSGALVTNLSGFPVGERPMIHVGQDEACYKAYLLPKECWTIDGYSPLRPKEEGPSLMLSAFVGQCFFLGLPCPESVIDKVNAARADGTAMSSCVDAANAADEFESQHLAAVPEQKQPLPKEFLHEAKGVSQTEDVLDVLEAWFSGIEFLVEIDHSSGHDKFKPDGLNVYRMNANFGGQQAFIRTSEKLTEDCLGRFSGRCLEPGDDQLFVFGTAEGTPPPFNKPKAKLADYAGKQKGAYQILFERGLFDVKSKRTWTGHKDPESKAHVLGSSWREVLAACPDFKSECSLLFQLVMDRGHSIISSPKCHPEVVGDGIEYGWGHSKRMYRKGNVGNETEMRKNQRKRVFDSISADSLPLERLMRFSRKAREYKPVYNVNGGGSNELSLVSIETERRAQKLRRTHSNHRSIDAPNLVFA